MDMHFEEELSSKSSPVVLFGEIDEILIGRKLRHEPLKLPRDYAVMIRSFRPFASQDRVTVGIDNVQWIQYNYSPQEGRSVIIGLDNDTVKVLSIRGRTV